MVVSSASCAKRLIRGPAHNEDHIYLLPKCCAIGRNLSRMFFVYCADTYAPSRRGVLSNGRLFLFFTVNGFRSSPLCALPAVFKNTLWFAVKVIVPYEKSVEHIRMSTADRTEKEEPIETGSNLSVAHVERLNEESPGRESGKGGKGVKVGKGRTKTAARPRRSSARVEDNIRAESQSMMQSGEDGFGEARYDSRGAVIGAGQTRGEAVTARSGGEAS